MSWKAAAEGSWNISRASTIASRTRRQPCRRPFSLTFMTNSTSWRKPGFAGSILALYLDEHPYQTGNLMDYLMQRAPSPSQSFGQYAASVRSRQESPVSEESRPDFSKGWPRRSSIRNRRFDSRPSMMARPLPAARTVSRIKRRLVRGRRSTLQRYFKPSEERAVSWHSDQRSLAHLSARGRRLRAYFVGQHKPAASRFPTPPFLRAFLHRRKSPVFVIWRSTHGDALIRDGLPALTRRCAACGQPMDCRTVMTAGPALMRMTFRRCWNRKRARAATGNRGGAEGNSGGAAPARNNFL